MSLGSRRWGRALKPGFHLIVVHQAGLLHNRLAGGEDGEVRNAPNVEARRQLRIPLGVYLYYYGFSAMSLAVCATSGAAILHGPQQAAQKSTSTGTRAFCV